MLAIFLVSWSVKHSCMTYTQENPTYVDSEATKKKRFRMDHTASESATCSIQINHDHIPQRYKPNAL